MCRETSTILFFSLRLVRVSSSAVAPARSTSATECCLPVTLMWLRGARTVVESISN